MVHQLLDLSHILWDLECVGPLAEHTLEDAGHGGSKECKAVCLLGIRFNYPAIRKTLIGHNQDHLLFLTYLKTKMKKILVGSWIIELLSLIQIVTIKLLKYVSY